MSKIYKVGFKLDGKQSHTFARADTAKEALRTAKRGMTKKRYSSFSVKKTNKKSLF